MPNVLHNYTFILTMYSTHFEICRMKKITGLDSCNILYKTRFYMYIFYLIYYQQNYSELKYVFDS